MKKLNSKGFMLTEVLIVSTLLLTVLLVVYIQFKSLKKNIDNDFLYNEVSSVYNLYNLKNYVEQEDFNVLIAKIELQDYYDITDCPKDIFKNRNYCQSIINTAKIKQLVVVHENLYSLIENAPFDSEMNDYIKTIEYEPTYGYRLIASFEDKTFANVRILNDPSFDEKISNECIPSIPREFTIKYISYNPNDLEDKNPIYIKEDYTSTAGCNTKITVVDYDKDVDSCYKRKLASEDFTVSSNIETNIGKIYYEIQPATLTFKFRKLGDEATKLAEDLIIYSECGKKYIPKNYKKVITDYYYDSSSKEEIVLGANENAEVTLYYKEGSVSDE